MWERKRLKDGKMFFRSSFPEKVEEEGDPEPRGRKAQVYENVRVVGTHLPPGVSVVVTGAFPKDGGPK